MQRQARWRIALVVALVLCAVQMPPTDVRAADAVGGSWQGQVTLNTFPCPGGGTCTGTFSGSVVATASGVDGNGQQFTVVFPDPTNPGAIANLAASFVYNEQCPLAATGTAQGSFTVSGGYVDDGGVISHDGTLNGNFGWLRVGLGVVLETYGGVLTGGGKTLATEQTLGVGLGAFAPINVPTTCSDVQSISATIGGSYIEE